MNYTDHKPDSRANQVFFRVYRDTNQYCMLAKLAADSTLAATLLVYEQQSIIKTGFCWLLYLYSDDSATWQLVSVSICLKYPYFVNSKGNHCVCNFLKLLKVTFESV